MESSETHAGVASPPASADERVRAVLRRTWGFEQLRPLQAEAIQAGLSGRDSLVVLPTGGGKSLCFQTPPLVAERTDLVVSPLIALMKDQVDGLKASGYPAAAIYSGMTDAERRETFEALRARRLRLVYVSPERVLTPGFLSLLREIDLRAIAIDEAHCISHWGHDFRAEYRRLAELRTHFPSAALHAFTATATPRVREDIALQLALRDPAVLVGSFDRPNLTYRVRARTDAVVQTLEALERRRGEAAIVYCITRRETEELAQALKEAGIRAGCYHAGLAPQERSATQDAFAHEQLDVVVATVAFGMGIDRSDVRLVLHTAIPKSIEHYQQEAGRAGRDGLPAECLLLYSGGDVARWQRILGAGPRSDGPAPAEERSLDDLAQVAAVQQKLLQDVCRYGTAPICRRRTLLEYFGEDFHAATCGACDVCLGELADYEDATVLAQKVLSCVARVEQRFGVGHVVDVLAGAATERVRKFGHERLTTYGLLREMPRTEIQRCVHALLDQGLLGRSAGEFPTLRLTPDAMEVLRGQRPVRLPRAEQKAAGKSRDEVEAWAGVDRALFEDLRALRRAIADEAGVAAFVIFGDKTLRDMARRKPRNRAELLAVHGVGERKAAELGEAFLECVARHRDATDGGPPPAGPAPGPRPAVDAGQRSGGGKARVPIAGSSGRRKSMARQTACEMFQRGCAIDEVKTAVQRAHSTTVQYLCEFIAEYGPESVEAWVSAERYTAIAAAAERLGRRRLTEIRATLGDDYDFDMIRIVLTHIGQVPESDGPGDAPERDGSVEDVSVEAASVEDAPEQGGPA